MRAARLLGMGLPEIAARSRQELSRRLDRLGIPARRSDVFAVLADTAETAPVRERARAGDRAGALAELVDRFSRTVETRFFDGAVSAATAAVLEQRMPAAAQEVVAAADAICAGRFDLLGYRGLRFGEPIDWHLDPVSGRRAPLVHWTLIDPLDAGRIGDSKVIWELNRHQWLVRLGQAYRLTRDERYADRFAEAVRSWMRSNPPGLGINWASSLEVAFRLIAWSWSLVLFRGSSALTPELFGDMLAAIAAHADHVARYLSHYFSPNTHLTGEALGLCYAGFVFPELRRARRWRDVGERVLLRESERQVLPDGVHFELSTCYQRYTVDIYLHYLLLARCVGVAVPGPLIGRVERMLDFLVAVRRPDASMPSIGDADGGWLLPLAPRAADDFRDVFATAAAVFRRQDCAWAAGDAAPETLWLLGPAGLASVDALAARPPASRRGSLFEAGGYAIMRSGWDRAAHQLVFDVGPLGCHVSAGHGHADLLSIQCAAFGEPMIVDPGTGCYTADAGWRDYFRGTAAHSTVTVDRADQAAPGGPFSWHARPVARLRRWVTTDALDVADAEHDGYARLPDPVIHRRRVLWVKPRYWVIVDDLAGAAEHEIALSFQFAPIHVAVDPSLWARAVGGTGAGLLVRPFATVTLKPDVLAGAPSPLQGWLSPDYGRRVPAAVLVYGATTRLPLRIATLLLPVRDAGAPVPDVEMLAADTAGPTAVSLEGGREIVDFADGEEIRREE